MATDLADWTQAVDVTAGTVTIGGTPSVNIANTPTVQIAAAQSIGISGTVTISGSVTITGTASVNVANTPAVTISGTPTVNIATGQSVGITGTVTVSISGTPSVNVANTPAVTISGTVTVSVSSGSVTITSGTVTVTQIQQNVVIDQLDSHSITPSTTVQTRTCATTAQHQYAAIIVALPAGSTYLARLAFRVHNTTKGTVAQWQNCQLIVGGTAPLQPNQFYFPIAADTGDTITYDYQLDGGSPGAITITVYGTGEVPPVVAPLRPDGHVRCIRSESVVSVVSNGNTVLLAPPTGWAYLIGRAYVTGNVGVASAAGALLVTIGGNSHHIARLDQTTSWSIPSAADYGAEGLLCDPTTAVTFSANTGSYVVVIEYDLVKVD